MKRLTTGVFIFIFLTLFLFNGVLWYSYGRLFDFMDRELGEKLKTISILIAKSVEPELLEDIKNGREEKLELFHYRFDYLIEDIDIWNLYIFDQGYNELVSIKNAGGKEGELSLQLDFAPVSLALSGVASYGKLREAGGVILKSAYAPIIDPWGEVVGAVGIEADARFFEVIPFLRNIFIFMSILSIVGVLSLGLVFYLYERRLMKIESRILKQSAILRMGDISGLIAHEMKNPIAVMRLLIEQKSRKVKEEEREFFNSLLDEVQRIDDIVTKYLKIGKVEIDKKLLEIQNVVKDTLTELTDSLKEKSVEVLYHPGQSMYIDADPSGLQYAVRNIILNALEATGEGGKIEITIAKEKRKRKDFAVLSIKDNGPGIPKNILKKTLEPFFTTKEKGSGLGLYIVKKMMELHRGKVEIISEEGKGTVVKLLIPPRKRGE